MPMTPRDHRPPHQRYYQVHFETPPSPGEVYQITKSATATVLSVETRIKTRSKDGDPHEMTIIRWLRSDGRKGRSTLRAGGISYDAPPERRNAKYAASRLVDYDAPPPVGTRLSLAGDCGSLPSGEYELVEIFHRTIPFKRGAQTALRWRHVATGVTGTTLLKSKLMVADADRAARAGENAATLPRNGVPAVPSGKAEYGIDSPRVFMHGLRAAFGFRDLFMAGALSPGVVIGPLGGLHAKLVRVNPYVTTRGPRAGARSAVLDWTLSDGSTATSALTGSIRKGEHFADTAFPAPPGAPLPAGVVRHTVSGRALRLICSSIGAATYGADAGRTYVMHVWAPQDAPDRLYTGAGDRVLVYPRPAGWTPPPPTAPDW